LALVANRCPPDEDSLPSPHELASGSWWW
jgi:hypothetical protein